MWILSTVVLLVLMSFAGVLLVGAPYVPTLTPQVQAALELIDLQPGQTLLELGSGDGTVLLAAAKMGLNVVGIELNPLLVAISWLRTWRYRRQIRIIWGDFWRVQWPELDGVFTFLLDKFMIRLDKRMQEVKRPLVSFAFKIPDRVPDKSKDGIFLYQYE